MPWASCVASCSHPCLQEDALFATQTPREAITFSARLRLPASTSKSSITDLVEGMITSLGLEKCANTLIGDKMIPGAPGRPPPPRPSLSGDAAGISGGEKKRTAIGVELIGDPGILFLDEPTSGLDSYAAFQVVKILKSLAGNGRTVITTIHQPSSEVFEMFDDTMLLADGRIVYNDRCDDSSSLLAAQPQLTSMPLLQRGGPGGALCKQWP